MRRDLDHRILSMRQDKINMIAGKDFITRLKYYVRLFNEERQQNEYDRRRMTHAQTFNGLLLPPDRSSLFRKLRKPAKTYSVLNEHHNEQSEL